LSSVSFKGDLLQVTTDAVLFPEEQDTTNFLAFIEDELYDGEKF
jgi:hypothetical protein